jgi:transposase, IS605 orfB family
MEKNRKIKLVRQIIYKRNDPEYEEMDELCFKSKNLYNATLYTVRQSFIKNGEYLNYNRINKIFTEENNVDYRVLPAKVAKHTQMLVDFAMKSFFALVKKKKKEGYDKNVKLPKYLDKTKGRMTVHYERGALSFKKRKGYIHLSKTEIYIKLPEELNENDIKFVRIVPGSGKFTVEIGFERELEPQIMSGSYASIDPGVNNLVTMVDTVTKNPVIINGKPLKSINQWYNKKIAEMRSETEKLHGKYWSKKMSGVTNRRNNKIKDYMHKASAYIVNHLVSNRIGTLIIGESKEWKQDTNMYKINNQNFVCIPFEMLKSMLEYKCKLAGIEVVRQHEAYTSKCSFLDNEEIRKHEKYKGSRPKRGCFKTSSGRKVNADVNSACNIMKKYLLKVAGNCTKLLHELAEVFSTPCLKIKTF